MMAKEEAIEVRAIVEEKLPNGMFRIRLKDAGSEALAHMSGKIRRFKVRVLPGDEVLVALSPYDLTRGRIIYRYK